MKKASFLKRASDFEGYRVGPKLSDSHDGEREVYLVFDGAQSYTLTLFNLTRGRYASGAGNKKDVRIDEIELCRKLPKDIFPAVVKSGVSRRGPRRLAWMLQQYFAHNTLADEMLMQSGLSRTDTLLVARSLLKGLHALSRITRGGGHYNLKPDHILVDYDGNTLRSVRIIGLSAAGEAYIADRDSVSFSPDMHFTSPEAAKGVYGAPADIYSVGMLMIYMLTGSVDTLLFDIPFETPVSEFRRAVLEKARGIVPSQYMLVLSKATEPSHEKRLASYDTFKSVITFLENKEAKGKVTSPVAAPRPAYSAPAPSKAREKKKKDNPVKDSEGGLAAVAGMAELKVRLMRDFVDIVRNSSLAVAYGIKPPNGILLYGAPGCGKTFIAENIARESGLPYRVVNPSQLGSIYVHGAQGKIADTFEEAGKDAPVILIFDEFDAVVPSRDKADNQANEVNEMLTQLNNCADRGIYVICTSNRPDMIDPAVLRAGRLDAKYYVGLPDADARRELFALELGKRPCAPDINLDTLSEATAGFTCSDISCLVKETARECFGEAIRSGEKDAVIPITSARILAVISKTVPSVSPAGMKRYHELKSRMEHTGKSSDRPRPVGFYQEKE